MNRPEGLTAEEQTTALAQRYSQRAEAYDHFWSPVIRPVAESLLGHLPLSNAMEVVDVGTGTGALLPSIQQAAPLARILGIDRSEGMLRLARARHAGPLVQMDVQKLGLRAGVFDAALVAFVLFHLPRPEWCVHEIHRVLKPGGVIGTVTWGVDDVPAANAVWDEELQAAGATVLELPATDNRSCCDSLEKMTTLLEHAGFVSIKVWRESLEHHWHPDDYFEYHIRSTSRLRLQSLSVEDRETCLDRVRQRLASRDDEQYVYRGEVVMATARKANHAGGGTRGEDDG